MFDSGSSYSPSSPAPEEPWEQWFAWRPVEIHGKRKWLTKVWRKRVWFYGDQRIQHPYNYIYGTLFDVIRNEK